MSQTIELFLDDGNIIIPTSLQSLSGLSPGRRWLQKEKKMADYVCAIHFKLLLL